MGSTRHSCYNKHAFSRHYTDWTGQENVYIVKTDQKDFMYSTSGTLDYKKTIENFKKAGYTNVYISYVGRNVTF